jgi:protein-glutamine gamma-glutamyltransferase
MPTDASFRFSTYLTLALACVALGYAEFEMLPEVAVFGALAVIGLGVLYFLESRVAFLSIPAANRLGMAIGLVYLMWAAYRIKRELDTGEFAAMGWHTFIMALCGPLVMLVLVAKVARSDKHAGDYWTLHGVALAGIGLAAAFAEEPLCFVLVGFYLAAAVWSLTLLHLGRAQGTIPPIPGGKQPATKAVAVSADPTGHRTDFRPALLWALIAVAIAFPLYLLTPRSEASKADFGKPRIEIGYAADQMVDLNRTGPLKVNTEMAFEVAAKYPDGTPKIDLSADQRWRGKALRHYANGEWKPTELGASPPITPLARRLDAWAPPKFGPGQFTLEFDVPARVRGTFVADPVVWAPDQPPPLAYLSETGAHGWLPVNDGTFFWDPATRARGAARRYVQVYRTPPELDVSPQFRFAVPNFDASLAHMRHNPVPRVKEYADQILSELVRTGELPADFRDERSLMPKPEYRDKIARRFTAHLAMTPALRYTTDLKRENTRVDPIEDFLFHSKAGHCERFATALVLMLRSQGIPAMFILGFKGCEHVENGQYIVRQEHAHAWVEALVPVPNQPAPRTPLDRVYYWRSLDPTPGAQAVDAEGGGGWLTRANTWMESQFQEYVTNYTPEQRQKALGDFAKRLARPETIAGIAGVFALMVAGRYVRRRLAKRAEQPPTISEAARWFGELVALLAAHGLVPAPGDTPMEFATTAATALRQRPGCAEVADVPLTWANAYYQDRFGGQPPSDARMAELEAQLAALRRALTQTP